MQVCRFHVPGFGACVGVVSNGQVHNATMAGLCGSIHELLFHLDPWGLAETVVRSVAPSHTLSDLDRRPDPSVAHLLAPIDRQEVWASGVTYFDSREARRRESQTSDIYSHVYTAERPELFFKATPNRTVGPNDAVTIRSDSDWDVPEPELAIVLSPDLRVVGYTVGNDVSSRRIEGENPLYLPQAKVWVGSCSLGPVITLARPGQVEPGPMAIRLEIARAGEPVSVGATDTGQMKRSVAELLTYLGRANAFPDGVVLLTGTGIVPDDGFTLQPDDVVTITIDGIGALRNGVRRV